MEISKKEFFKTFKKIVDAKAPSGRENNVVKVVYDELKSDVSKFEFCGQGSLLAKCKNNNSKNNLNLLIDAHIDEIGFLVSDILASGFIKFAPVGGWWGHVIVAQRFNIITRNNKIITGIVGSTPVHILPADKRGIVVKLEDMYLDIGVKNKQEALDVGINIGDPIVKNTEAFLMVNPDYICAKAIDNRISCAILTFIVKSLAKINHPNNVTAVFSVQEEVGLRGVKSASYKVNPDIAIVIDTTLSHDQPGMCHNNCNLGNGPAIEVLDATIVSNRKFLKFAEKIAKENKINYTYACLTGGGTNGGYVYRTQKGVTTIVLSIPTRYLHTHNEICHIKDSLNCIKLVVEMVKKLTSETAKKIQVFYD